MEKLDDYNTQQSLVSNGVDVKNESKTACYECHHCKQNYENQAHYEEHIHSRKINCSKCNTDIPNKCYRHHLKTVHGSSTPESNANDANDKEKPAEGSSNADGILCYSGVVCTLCNQVYSSDINLKKHMYNVHRMVRVKCDVCDKEINKKSLVRHMKNVHSAKALIKKIDSKDGIPCTYCGRRCTSSVSMLDHVRAVHERYECSKCDFAGTRKHLQRHMRKQHNNEVYQCSSCNKILKSKNTLKEHMWIHSDQRRYICAVCGLQFKRTSNYHGHMKSHQGKRFQCRICLKFFLRKRYLAVHEETIHNYYGEGVSPQEKRYQCEICGVKLKWKNNLLTHMRIHTGEKPYKCKICGEDFTSRGSFRTHMVKHSICPSTENDSSSLIQEAYLGTRQEIFPESSLKN